jgi:copper chaperone CopZ
MRKIFILGFALLAFAAFVSLPNAAYACGGDKANTTKSASVDKTNAQTVSAKGSSCDASAKAACTGKANTTSASADRMNKSEAKFATAQFSVKGMTCGGCEHSVTTALNKVDGVVKVEEVSHVSGKAVVDYDPAKCNAETLAKAISDKGFSAEVVPAVATSGEAGAKVCTATGKTCTPAEAAACKAACTASKEAKQANAEKTKATGTY